jgi:hypothetical protein
MEKLLETYALIKRNYVAQADDGKLFEGAIAGMLASLDAHSQYMNKDDMREIDRENTGSYVGIGIEVEDDRGQMRVVATTGQAPAERAGIQAGDLLVSIDGTPVAGLSSSEGRAAHAWRAWLGGGRRRDARRQAAHPAHCARTMHNDTCASAWPRRAWHGSASRNSATPPGKTWSPR